MSGFPEQLRFALVHPTPPLHAWRVQVHEDVVARRLALFLLVRVRVHALVAPVELELPAGWGTRRDCDVVAHFLVVESRADVVVAGGSPTGGVVPMLGWLVRVDHARYRLFAQVLAEVRPVRPGSRPWARP
jgi:hypothetical protein